MRNLRRHLSRPSLPTATAGLLAASLVGLAASLGAGREEALRSWAGLTAAGLGEGRWWEVVTHLFLPGRVPWLLGVKLPLLILAGRHLEAVVGRRHVVAVFVGAGAAGGVAQKAAGWLHGAADLPLAGPGWGVLGIFLALACAAPELDLVPPLSLRAGGAGGRLRLRHGALGVVLGAASVLVTAEAVGAFTGRGEPWAAPAAGALAAALVACLYLRGLGFGRRRGVRSPEEEAAWAVAVASEDGGDEPVFAAPMAAAAGQLVVPRFTEVERRMSPREYISARIDPILEKISRHGLGSLTDDERRLLANAREKMLRRR